METYRPQAFQGQACILPRVLYHEVGCFGGKFAVPESTASGRGGADSLGIRLSAVLALIFCVMGLILSRYVMETPQKT